MLDRAATERLVRAARPIAALKMELPAGYTLVQSTLITDLANALPDIDI